MAQPPSAPSPPNQQLSTMPPTWPANVIIADADYIDKVAFSLIVNFERMIGRRIPPADMGVWLDCAALDGGLRPGENAIQVVLVHGKGSAKLANFAPASYAGELDGKAFNDKLGEFSISCVEVEDGLTTADDLTAEILAIAANAKETRRIVVVPNAETGLDCIRQALRHADEDKHITVLAMQPLANIPCRQEILGYSLMQALGIRSDELGMRN